MIFYKYSREESIGRVINGYKEYLVKKGLISSQKDEAIIYSELALIESGEFGRKSDRLLSGMLHLYKNNLKLAKDRYSSIDEFKEIVKSRLNISVKTNTLEVLEFLYLFFINEMEKDFSGYLDDYLNQYLIRFEVSGKLYEEYSPGGKNGLGDYSLFDNYILLAVNLLMYYRYNKSLRVLNTILKLNDLIDLLIVKKVKTDLSPLLVYSFITEEKEVNRLYDTRGFRLPTD